MTEVQHRSDFTVTLADTMGDDRRICSAAQVSLKGSESVDSKESARLINYLMSNRHGTPFEHCEMQWMITQPIVSWREHYRHRMASYNEMSGRWTQLEPVFYVPPPERPCIKVEGSRTGDYSYRSAETPGELKAYTHHCERLKKSQVEAYADYEESIEDGLALEVAREFLPLTIYSSAWVTMNLRGLMNFLSLRASEAAMWEIRQVAYLMEEDFKVHFPLVWEAWDNNDRIAP